MSPDLHITLHLSDWLHLFGQYLLLSLLSVGGAISTTSDMYRFLVEQHGWLSPAQFNASIAIAQAAPGPNVLFVALMGWNVGLNAGGWGSGLLGVALTMTGIMVPSTTLTYMTAQWGHRNRQLRWVRAFKQGMAPIVIGLLLATAWILGRGVGDGPLASHWPLWLTTIASALLVWRTRLHMLWLLAAGAALGWFQLL